MMWKTSLIPFVLQAIVMCFDEFYFHVRRGLPRWERIGHPLDTLTVIVCMAYVVVVPFSSNTLFLYILLAAFSTLFVTKDEFVHKKHCPASEQWLHALLFSLHPITLAFAGFIWPVTQGVEVTSWIAFWLNNGQALRQFLILQLGAMALFLVYQVFFWNWIYEKNVPD